ncbi:FAD-dependent tricarballylate dehydrogenase TcuA [Bacillus sp. Marseille-P3661]|uniref:FAD-dependent tricarballylate dehydrogenase TcuA n=1 Tax=Bacillus sp. Marseille-P3661 TaxID=1936234 RepID=UPI0015E19261|nr:FAD-dependent tricarballylate dehydrogenase TcuA [Bacillus sp. Marseille-P3661]
MNNVEKCDVLIVGGGTAAYAAAVSAKMNGAEKVIMLEKAPEDQAGGNPRYTVAGFRFVHEGAQEIREFLPQFTKEEFERQHHPAYTAEAYLADLKRVTGGRMDEEIAKTLVSESNDAVHWLLELGHKWEPMTLVVIDGISYFGPGHNIRSEGGGINQLRRWNRIAQNLGIEVRYNSPVTALLGNQRKVEGVRVLGPEKEYEISANAVILCSGGFQASAEKRAKYLGKNADLMKVRGSRHNTGEVLEMAINLGAMPSGQWQGAHASPISLTAADVECSDDYNHYSYPMGITVNSQGVRFFDEGEAESTYTYAKTGWEIIAQSDGIAYQIFDQQTVPLLREIYQSFTPVKADTINELAVKLGLEPKVLEHTVNEFNQSVDNDTKFEWPHKDGKKTSNLTPQKSNWAVPIIEAPYVAYPVTGGITFTFGGLKINSDAQVVNTTGNPIEGLYASGDILGLFYNNYPSCTGQTRNAVFGRLAGKNAAKSVSTV